MSGAERHLAIVDSRISIQPDWCRGLTLQQQSVLFLAGRGPDGVAKDHPCKDIQRHYRGTILVAAKFGRMLHAGEKGDSFMSMDKFERQTWDTLIERFLHSIDSLPHHFVMHLMHGAEIIGYKHPDPWYRHQWSKLYFAMVDDMHCERETEAQMDERLNDWGREGWE